jgi:ABC-type hemin transport system substrate-binding protein
MSTVVEPPLSRGIRQLLHTLDVPLVPAVTARPSRFLKSTSTKINSVGRGVHLTSSGKKLENKSRARSKKQKSKKKRKPIYKMVSGISFVTGQQN